MLACNDSVSILHLDITGHQAGEAVIYALAEVVNSSQTMESISFDENKCVDLCYYHFFFVCLLQRVGC